MSETDTPDLHFTTQLLTGEEVIVMANNSHYYLLLPDGALFDMKMLLHDDHLNICRTINQLTLAKKKNEEALLKGATTG